MIWLDELDGLDKAWNKYHQLDEITPPSDWEEDDYDDNEDYIDEEE